MYRITALPSELARAFAEAPDAVVVSSSERSGPCRHCLRESADGERLALASFTPFSAGNPYRETGPIFVHADGCARFEADSLPENYEKRRLVLRAYDRRGWIADAKVAEPGEFDAAVRALLSNADVSHVHARHLAYGCYAFLIERDPNATNSRSMATLDDIP